MTEELEQAIFRLNYRGFENKDQAEDFMILEKYARAQPREQVTPLAPQSSGATLKYKRVDLNLMKRNLPEEDFPKLVEYDRAIDDIKSKYGDLYVEVKE